jgi:hypothetical protein
LIRRYTCRHVGILGSSNVSIIRDSNMADHDPPPYALVILPVWLVPFSSIQHRLCLPKTPPHGRCSDHDADMRAKAVA